mgnify:CR=1 FL=1
MFPCVGIVVYRVSHESDFLSSIILTQLRKLWGFCFTVTAPAAPENEKGMTRPNIRFASLSNLTTIQAKSWDLCGQSAPRLVSPTEHAIGDDEIDLLLCPAVVHRHCSHSNPYCAPRSMMRLCSSSFAPHRQRPVSLMRLSSAWCWRSQ